MESNEIYTVILDQWEEHPFLVENNYVMRPEADLITQRLRRIYGTAQRNQPYDCYKGMKRLNTISFASMAMYIGIAILTMLVTACKSDCKLVVFHYDNGDDYFCEGFQRIVDKNGKIGFRDSMGNIAITPRFAFAFPFKEGYAKVTDTGHREAVDKRGEYHQWISDSWYYIDKAGTKHPELIKINGQIKSSVDGSPLQDAIVTNNRTGESSRSDVLGRFSVLCETGDSLNISYVGLKSQTIPVNPADSTEWKISMREYDPII